MKSEAVNRSQGLAAEKTLQLVAPIYNEGENVKILYSQLIEEKIPFDTLKFVYDFDEDNTLPFIAEISANDSRVFAEKNEYGKGVVNALKWAMNHAKPGPFIIMMADNSDKLSGISKMVEFWQQGATIVCPSRYMKGGVQHGGGLIKAGLSRLACTSLSWIGFPTADATNSFKLYDGEWLAKQDLESTGGFEVGIELCYKAYKQGREIKEFPTVWKDREAGESRFKVFEWLPLYLKWYFSIIGEVIKQMFLGKPKAA